MTPTLDSAGIDYSFGPQHAASSKNLDICKLLLRLGLREALVEKCGPYGK